MTMDDVFSKIHLNPNSVTFLHSPKKQVASLTITNYSSETIIFKMKSTRPNLFRMNPVYGTIEPRKEVDIRLTCKGMVESQPPQNERFTVVVAVAPQSNENKNARKLWEIHKKSPASHETTKKKIQIVFITEQTETTPEEYTPIVEDPDDDIIRAPKAKIRRKSRGGVEDDVGYTLDKTVTEAGGTAKAVKGSQIEDASFSGEESRSRSVMEETRTPSHTESRTKKKSSKKSSRKSSKISKSEEIPVIRNSASFKKKTLCGFT